MTRRLINPTSLYDGAPIGLSQGVLDARTGLLFISGQVDWNLDHQVSHDTVAGQFEAALGKLGEVLREAGAGVEHLLQLRIFVRGELEDHMPALAPPLAAFLGGSRVAITGVGVASLASRATLVEVEAVAQVP